MNRVALVGNPNAGKTTLFNALSGLRQRVGNYPGVTVEMKKGTADFGGEAVELIDLPGTYSLAPRSPDEMVAVDLLLGRAGEPPPDAILAIVDASNLERHLYLVTQLLELGRPVVLALNMIDVAQSQGVRIDHAALAQRMGVPVVPIRANKGVGLDELKRAITAAAKGGPPPRGPKFPEAFDREAAELAKSLGPDVPAYLVERLLLDIGGHTERRFAEEFGPGVGERVAAARQRLSAAGCAVPAVEAKARYAWIREATAGCVTRPAARPVTATDRLDRVLTHKLWGTLVFLGLMFVVFQSIFTWARPLMALIGAGQDWLTALVRDALPAGPLTDLLADGVLKGVGGVIVFLPQILILFGFIAVLEDCGYMARAAFLMDRLMAKCGLSGKSFIPLLSSVACAVPGIMATRVIENRRDRLATILVAPLMSCSARLPVYVLLIGAFLSAGRPWWVPGLAMFAMYLIGFVAAPLVALLLKRTLLRGETPVFVMEMPSYKRPSVRTVLRRMLDAAGAFLRRAGTLILASMVLVWALLYFPHTDAEGRSYAERIAAVGEDSDAAKDLRAEWTANSLLGRFGHWMEPAVRPLGWDWRIGVAALASFPAREVVVGTLGIVYRQGDVTADAIREAGMADAGETPLGRALKEATWPDGRPVFTLPAVVSLLVFFALCCQCASTLAVIKRETHSWGWPAFTFGYMTALAYLGALVVYQVGSRLG
ncbi:MAG: ferrous iron transport protein B [Gemmataceae bacterium]